METPLNNTELKVDPRRVLRVLLAANLGIVVMGTLANLVIHHVAESPDTPLATVMRRIDLVNEPSVHQWYSSLLHMVAACCCGFIARWSAAQRDGNVIYWTTLSILFIGLSIDEAVMIHEMAVNPVRQRLGTSGLLSIAWIIPGAVLVIVVGLFYLRFVLQLDRATRRTVILAAATFVTGALVMEMPGGWLYERYGFGTWHYIASYAVEEFFELCGMALFIFALISFIGRHDVPVRITFSGIES